MEPKIEFDFTEARRFHKRAMLMEGAPSGDLASVVGHLGFIQLDPLNVCGRMHDLILRNRVAGYRAGDLLRWLHGADTASDSAGRGGFEQFLPGANVLVAFPWEAWPFIQPTFRRRRASSWRYHGVLTAAEEKLAARILDEIRDRGPLSADDIAHEGRGLTAWGSRGSVVKILLEKLFAHGRVLISSRRNFRRIYDVPERVVPSEYLHRPEPPNEEAARWELLLRVRQRRLLRLRAAEASLLEDILQPVSVLKISKLYALRSDVSDIMIRLSARRASGEGSTPMLLAPLDPLIYDRALTRSLWGFDYTWEVYTPAAKRVRGYYALPVLAENSFVGHVEPRFDYKTGKMMVLSKRLRRGHAVSKALKDLSRCLASEKGASA